MMVSLYISLKWLHVVGACIGFGSNLAHLFWLISANADSSSGAEKLRVVKKIDDLLSVPAYAIAIGCGITMWLMQWPTNTSWIIVSLVLSTILTIMGISFGPFMKKWIRMADEHALGDGPLRKMSYRLTGWWALIVASVLVILYLMITKPAFW